MFHSHLLYCSTIISCVSQTALNTITTVKKSHQNYYQILSICAYFSPLPSTQILTFEKILTQAKLLFMRTIAFNYAPRSFTST